MGTTLAEAQQAWAGAVVFATVGALCLAYLVTNAIFACKRLGRRLTGIPAVPSASKVNRVSPQGLRAHILSELRQLERSQEPRCMIC